MSREQIRVLFYIPNIIDYFRLVLLLIAWANIEKTTVFMIFDGYFAKRFNQISAFGAWLDVVIDNLGRGVLWTYLFRAGYIITVIEWIVFSCTQQYGAKWKEWFESAPFLVGKVFQNNFRTPIGITAITAGLQGLPMWLYFMRHYGVYLSGTWVTICNLILYYCIAGRVISLYVELWIVKKHLNQLLSK